jgi:hypothetical protein
MRAFSMRDDEQYGDEYLTDTQMSFETCAMD